MSETPPPLPLPTDADIDARLQACRAYCARFEAPETVGLWEILVPTVRNSGRPFRTKHHKEWDKRVRRITGGLTILTPAKGQWIGPGGELYSERMIPVRIVATKAQIDQVIQITFQHYDQLAVLAYRLSSEVLLVQRGEK